MALIIDDVDLVRFDDQIADRQDQPLVVDNDTGSLAVGAQRSGAARVGQRVGPHLDQGGEEFLGVDALGGTCGGAVVSARDGGEHATGGNDGAADQPAASIIDQPSEHRRPP
jgi:hypothetical protein